MSARSKRTFSVDDLYDERFAKIDLKSPLDEKERQLRGKGQRNEQTFTCILLGPSFELKFPVPTCLLGFLLGLLLRCSCPKAVVEEEINDLPVKQDEPAT